MRGRPHPVSALVIGLSATVLMTVPSTRLAAAHVDYVSNQPETRSDPVAFFLAVVTDPVNAALIGVVAVAIAAGLVGYIRVGRHIPDFVVLGTVLEGYEDLVPWMLRLSLGLPLVGAGFAGYYFTPSVDASFRLFSVGLGFLLLFGLATRAVAVVGLGAFVGGVLSSSQLLLAVEYVGGFLGLILLGSGRPSADEMLQRIAETEGTVYRRVDPVHVISRRFRRTIEPLRPYAPTVVRIGLGVTFVYLGLVEKLLDPGHALLVVAKYDLTGILPLDPGLWVVGAGLVELTLGLALIVGVFTRASAALAFLVLTTTLFGLPDDPVLAHVTLFGLSSVVFSMGSGPIALDNHLDGMVSGSDSNRSQVDATDPV